MTISCLEGVDTTGCAYEELRTHALSNPHATPPAGFGVMLHQGVAAFLLRLQCGLPVVHPGPPVPSPQTTPIPTDELRAGIVRILASMAMAQTLEVLP